VRRLILILVAVILATPVRAGAQGQPFISIAFHDVVDRPADLEADAVTTRTFVQVLDRLKASGWTAVSLDDLADAASGRRRLPDKAILLTFDDGRESLYTRVFPLLKAYRYPAVAFVVGSWMEGEGAGAPEGEDRVRPPDTITWAQAREMQASGLIEFGSHSYDLHHGVLANPQGNLTPAAVTWRYDPRRERYEDDAQFDARIRDDLLRSIAVMEARLGRKPRAIAWPYGRYAGPALEVARSAGLSFSLDLEPEPSSSADPYAIHRYYPSGDPTLGDIVRYLRSEVTTAPRVRIACTTLDGMAAVGDGKAQDEALGRMIEGLRELGASTVIIDANAALASPTSPLGEVYFPTALRPLRKDILGRATWQIRSRAGVDVFLRLPLGATTAAVGEANVPRLYADMIRHARADGVVLDLPDVAAGAVTPDRPWEIRARRAALDSRQLDARAALGLASYRAAAGIDPRLRLMVETGQPEGPPEWADIALLPPAQDPEAVAAAARRLQAQGWLRLASTGRVAFSLPKPPAGSQVSALQFAQRRGAAAFALCPRPPEFPPAAKLSAAFSAATYPHRP
jgi:peptidoglycan/xylan/chitin deacetylase (PgdA/CDA1 family)